MKSKRLYINGERIGDVDTVEGYLAQGAFGIQRNLTLTLTPLKAPQELLKEEYFNNKERVKLFVQSKQGDITTSPWVILTGTPEDTSKVIIYAFETEADYDDYIKAQEEALKTLMARIEELREQNGK